MRTIRLRTDWMSSGWLQPLGAEARLAWVCLLCHVDAFGKDGALPMPKIHTLANQWRLQPGAVKAMFSAAHTHGAVSKDEKGRLVVVRWRDYQGKAKPKPAGPIRYAASGWENITDPILQAWNQRYVGVDVRAELLKAHAWVSADFEARKKKEWKAYLQNWLLRAMSPKPQAAARGPAVKEMSFD